MFSVVIRKLSDSSVVNSIGSASTARGLERTLRGLQINLNHEEYYASIEEKDTAKQEKKDGHI